MAFEVVWTASALRDRKAILKYWLDRNGSSAYSKKLYKRWEVAIKLVSRNPYLGRPTRHEGVRVVLIGHYNIFYQPGQDVVHIVRIIDGRRGLSGLQF